MRVAVSDYDGTLRRNNEVAASDLAAIIKWVEVGNKFGLATGRDLGMVLHETNKYGIPFDFLVCLNGAALYDHDAALLKNACIEDSLVPAILRHPACDASIHLDIMGTEIQKIFFRGKDSWFLRMGLPYKEIDYETALSSKNVGQISLGYLDAAVSAEWARQLNLQFAGRVVAHHNANTIDINPVGTDKAHGIADVLKIKGWTTAEVMVIGDGGNDLGMVEAFEGYTLPNASVRMKKAAAMVDSLADMLNS